MRELVRVCVTGCMSVKVCLRLCARVCVSVGACRLRL